MADFRNSNMNLVHSQSQEQLDKNKDEQSKKLSAGHLLAPLAVTMLAGTFAFAGHGKKPEGSGVSSDAPAIEHAAKDMKQSSNWESITPKPGEGADSIGRQVDPQVYSGPESSSVKAQALNQIIEQQGPNPTVVEADRDVAVPILPGAPQK